MLIKDMFKKPIDRDIKGVIVVGEGEDSNAKQELEEYVVTRELSKHFREFFDNYKKGIVGETTKTGVWISGFFGSGKSHFLKILSYLLDGQKLIGGKRAVDYFIDDHKIEDAMVLADMKLAADTPTDVVLFNIDSKSEQTGKQSKDAIVTVFLKVFNEMQGFYGSMPYVADLERQLSEDGRYNEFKQEFAAATGKSWEDSRRKFDFIQDDIVDVLVDMDYMSEPAARNWCEKAAEPYQISIENFARILKKITNLITALDFMQNEPISDTVRETTFRVYFVGEDNERISNENIVVADKRGETAAERMFRLRFSFKNRKYDNKKPYYLVAYDDKNSVEVLRRQVVMDIAMADDFGFGF